MTNTTRRVLKDLLAKEIDQCPRAIDGEMLLEAAVDLMKLDDNRSFRIDHLKSMVNYCLEQAESSGINTLGFADNAQSLQVEDSIQILIYYKRLLEQREDAEVLLVECEHI